jgi:S1-C subfamily serine protease
LKKVEGALVAEVPPGGAAAEAGIVPGDVVLAVDGRSIASGADLAAKIGSMAKRKRTSSVHSRLRVHNRLSPWNYAPQ